METFSLKTAPSQEGKIAIVTGANIGLGYETAKGLAQKGAKVIMACRNEQKAINAKNAILAELPEADLDIILLDLNSLDSVKAFAAAYKAKYQRLDLLINNAGIMVPPLSKTKEGFESQFGVNYLAHFLLTGLLLPLLNQTKGARIVSLSSIAHENGKIDFDNLNAEKKYSRIGFYNQSKLACLMFAYELRRRLEASGSPVLSVAAHPGVSPTNLAQHIPKILYYLLYPLFMLMTHSVEKGALPTLMAALDTNVEGGEYFGPLGRRGMTGKPGKVDSKPHAKDKEVAKKLWEVSEKLVGFKYDF